MNLFRSEEHIARWLGGREPGRRSPSTKLSDLAHAWWGDRVDPDWRPHTREQNAAILERLGLTGPFWRSPRRPSDPPAGMSRRTRTPLTRSSEAGKESNDDARPHPSIPAAP